MLYVTMRIPENEKQDGIVLAWSKGHLRIAMEDCADVVELRDVNGQWTLEDGTPVELDGLFTDGSADKEPFAEFHPCASAAGYLGTSAVVISWSRYHLAPAISVH